MGVCLAWNEIWRSPIPPMIRMFLRRACANILPQNAKLFRRHITTSPFCPECGVEVKTISHVLTKCRGMSEIWRSEPFNILRLDTNESMWAIFIAMKNRLP